MGGSVVAADRPGGGADFQLHLPLETASPSALGQWPQEAAVAPEVR